MLNWWEQAETNWALSSHGGELNPMVNKIYCASHKALCSLFLKCSATNKITAKSNYITVWLRSYYFLEGMVFLMKSFAEKLKHLRQSAGYTQAQAASLLGISASAVGMYEQGRREPDLELTQRICRLYDVTPDFLVNGNSEAPAEINEIIAGMRKQMKMSQGIMFNGVPISEEDTEKIFDAMMLAAQLIMQKKSESKEKSMSEQ